MLSQQVARRLGISRRHTDRVIVLAFKTIVRHINEREPVKLEDFGTFEVTLRKGWNGRHPATGKRVPISDRRAIRFRPGKRLRRRIDHGT